MIFLFKALSGEDESFERDYEVPYDTSLLDFHNFIVDDLGFDKNEMASFFTSNENWAKLQEYTSEDMYYGENDSDFEELTPVSMENVTLGQIIQEKHSRLLYVFDLLSNRGLFIELIKSFKGDEDEVYPRVALSAGEAPIQVFEDNVADEVSEMFDDIYDDDMYDDDYDDFGGGSYDNEYY